MTDSYQWVVSQIGARQHYSVPRGFESTDRLKRLYTDAWFPGYLRWMLRLGGRSLRAFGGRWHSEIPGHKVVHQNLHAICDSVRHELHSTLTTEQIHEEFLRIGRQFDRWVCQSLGRRNAIEPGRDAFFGFNTGSLQTLRMLRDRGVKTVLDQIDPAKIEEDIVLDEAEKWPGWEVISGRVPQAYWDHMAAEWAAADVILVNSNWSKAALIKQGASPERICVVPIGYESIPDPSQFRRQNSGPLKVLWLGTVILRKGIQYLIEAAKRLKDSGVQFVVAGPIGISRRALLTAPPSMTFLGRVTRDQAEEVYRGADLFVLPTLSDGFALTQLEAMSKGLPVIATPNCGEVVTDGKDGLIVPAGDSEALAEAIARLNDDRKLLAEMSRNALQRSKEFELPSNTLMVENEVRKRECGDLHSSTLV